MAESLRQRGAQRCDEQHPAGLRLFQPRREEGLLCFRRQQRVAPSTPTAAPLARRRRHCAAKTLLQPSGGRAPDSEQRRRLSQGRARLRWQQDGLRRPQILNGRRSRDRQPRPFHQRGIDVSWSRHEHGLPYLVSS